MPKAAKEKAPKKEKATKEKKEKDPNAPKKNMGAYMFFCADKRESVKAEHPELKATEIASKLGALWKELDDKGKEKYNKQAEADKVRYQKAMEEYKADAE